MHFSGRRKKKRKKRKNTENGEYIYRHNLYYQIINDSYSSTANKLIVFNTNYFTMAIKQFTAIMFLLGMVTMITSDGSYKGVTISLSSTFSQRINETVRLMRKIQIDEQFICHSYSCIFNFPISSFINRYNTTGYAIEEQNRY